MCLLANNLITTGWPIAEKNRSFLSIGLDSLYRVLSGLVLQRIAVMHRVQICVYGVPPGTVWACGPATQLRDTRLDLPWGSIQEGQVKWSLRPRTGLCRQLPACKGRDKAPYDNAAIFRKSLRFIVISYPPSLVI